MTADPATAAGPQLDVLPPQTSGTRLRFGQADAVDPTLASLLGRPGRTIGDYVRDHAAIWA